MSHVDTAIARAVERLHANNVGMVEIRQVGAGVSAARAEVEAVKLPLAATCDWGDCNEQADYLRYSAGLGDLGWLPVCERHRGARLVLTDAPPSPADPRPSLNKSDRRKAGR